MEAHRSYERFEHGQHVAGGGELPQHAQLAALTVAVIAALLAVATFFSNEALKEVITGETHGATAHARLESNRVKIDIAKGNATLLRVLGASTPAGTSAVAKAREHETHLGDSLRPADAHLTAEIKAGRDEVDHANSKHLAFELAEVAFEVGIVLASVSIIARRRWLLGAAGAAATAGVALLATGLLLA
ncbi:MAG TPA: DUF4337 family protein [Solirubrobacterales bacterium]|nr:DUF4337 family protein [Solirubrobacterales bacterium]